MDDSIIYVDKSIDSANKKFQDEFANAIQKVLGVIRNSNRMFENKLGNLGTKMNTAHTASASTGWPLGGSSTAPSSVEVQVLRDRIRVMEQEFQTLQMTNQNFLSQWGSQNSQATSPAGNQVLQDDLAALTIEVEKLRAKGKSNSI